MCVCVGEGANGTARQILKGVRVLHLTSIPAMHHPTLVKLMATGSVDVLYANCLEFSRLMNLRVYVMLYDVLMC